MIPFSIATDGYLMSSDMLRTLAGKPLPPIKLLEHIQDDEYEYTMEVVSNDTLSVEIITLTQFKYEVAFEKITESADYLSDDDLSDIAFQIEEMVETLDHIKPHIKVMASDILIVIDCAKVDTDTIEYASKLMKQLPSLDSGYYWEY